MESYARVDSYFGMRNELRALLKREIDLVMVGAVKNPYIAREIERTKQLLKWLGSVNPHALAMPLNEVASSASRRLACSMRACIRN